MKDYHSVITVDRTNPAEPLYALMFPQHSDRIVIYQSADELKADLIAFGFKEAGAITALEHLEYKETIEPDFTLSAEQFAELTGPRTK